MTRVTFSMSKRALARLISFAAAGILTLSGFCYTGWRQAEAYRRGVEYGYQRSFQELADNVAAIDNALQKGRWVSSPAPAAALAGEISRRAYGAQADLSALPYAFVELESISKFLSQVGDFAGYINKQAAMGIPLTAEQTAEIRRLSDASSYLSAGLVRMLTVAREEELNIGRLLMENKTGGRLGDTGGFAQAVKEAENHFGGMPPLIYDGPFSDHIEQRGSVFLSGKPELDRKAAASRAAEYLDIQPALMQPLGETGGAIPAYRFRAVVDGGEISIAVTKQGGYCLSLTNSRIIGDPKIPFGEASQKAREYLEARGFDGMKETYCTRSGNTLLVSFAYSFNGVVYYPDLIKVGVALDTGRICVFESSGYLMNHTYRDLPKPSLTVNEAARVLPDGLLVSSAEVCVIPSGGLSELLCYMFTCIDEESRTYLIYVNAQTGAEEKIQILLEDENGSLIV